MDIKEEGWYEYIVRVRLALSAPVLYVMIKDRGMQCQPYPNNILVPASLFKWAHLQTLIWKAGECDQPPVVDISMYRWEPGTDGLPPTPKIGFTDVAPN